MLQRKIKSENITLVIPEKYCHVEENYDDEPELLKDLPIINPDAFCDDNVESKVQKIIEEMGVRIVKNAKLMEIF